MCIDDDDCERQNKECKKYCLWYLAYLAGTVLLTFGFWAYTGFGDVPWMFGAMVAGFGLGFFIIIFLLVQVPFYIYYWCTSWWCHDLWNYRCERWCVWLCSGCVWLCFECCCKPCDDEPANSVSRQPQINDNPQIPIDTGNAKITLDIEGQIYRIELNGNQNNIKLDTCSICLEKTVEKPQDCGHVFHKECLDKWLMKEKTCPNCRKNIRKS